MFLSEIYIYPIKSLGGISLQEAWVEERGLQYDRRWMLVDEQNQFLTQRKFPRMALCKTSLDDQGIKVSFPEMDDLSIPFSPQTKEKLAVTIWDNSCEAVVVSEEADRWFTEALQLSCRLVLMPETTKRAVDKRYATADNTVSFADGYPFLLIGQSSLDDLNRRLEEAVPMNRFRPNLVVKDAPPYSEDTWHTIQIGAVVFYGVKPCSRCVLTTVDQATGEKGKEPLKTLAGYRTTGNKVLFGQNLVYAQKGSTISVGDKVRLL